MNDNNFRKKIFRPPVFDIALQPQQHGDDPSISKLWPLYHIPNRHQANDKSIV